MIAQFVGIDGDAGRFHSRQHRRQRYLELFVELQLLARSSSRSGLGDQPQRRVGGRGGVAGQSQSPRTREAASSRSAKPRAGSSKCAAIIASSANCAPRDSGGIKNVKQPLDIVAARARRTIEELLERTSHGFVGERARGKGDAFAFARRRSDRVAALRKDDLPGATQREQLARELCELRRIDRRTIAAVLAGRPSPRSRRAADRLAAGAWQAAS